MKVLSRLFVLITVSLAALSGCVQIGSIPTLARSGDTIVLGLGGIKRNWQSETPKNLQITITDSAFNSYSLTPAHFFQAYPDYRSVISTLALDGSNGLELEPYDGSWFVSTALADSQGQPLILAAGAAKIVVAASNLRVVLNGQGQVLPDEGDLAEIPIEIIPGSPSNNNSSMQFLTYDNRGSHFLVRPASTPSTLIGGAYYVVNYLSDVNFGALKPAVYPVSHNPYINMNYTIKENGNGSGSFCIYIYNSAGFVASGPQQPKQGSLEDLGVHLEYFDPDFDVAMKANFTLDAAASYFVDVDGNRITELQPELLHSSDL